MSFENVVLTYPHPHIVVFVEDNTEYIETFLTEEEPVKLIQCGAFATGRDNQLIYCEDYNQYVEEFGKPNFKLYGQPGYNLAAALKTGYASAYVIRVMPDDATYANVVVTVRYKVTAKQIVEADPEHSIEASETPGKLTVEFKTVSLENAKTEEELKLAFEALKQYDPDDEGFITMPWLLFYQRGRGSYGNSTRILLADATAYDDPENTYRAYRVDVMEMGESLTVKERAYGSFNPDLFDSASKESLYLEDLICDPEEGLNKISCMINEALLQDIVEKYNEGVGAEETITTMDIVFGKTMSGTTNNFVEFTESSLVLSDAEGFSLFNGTEGSFDPTKPQRDDAITSMLVKAYDGDLDKMILSRYSSPADFMLDANFDNDVKRSMVRLALKREYDAMCYLDCGLLSTTDDVIQWLTENKDIYGYNVVKQLHHFKIRDVDYTGKTIPVTTTYHMASLIPQHIKTKGLNTPMALENARVTNCVKGSFLPVIDPDENDIKKEIYNLRGVYYETVKYGVYQRGVAITTQQKFSDRLDEFNEYILHLAVAKATSILQSKIYQLGEAEDRAAYKETANKELQYILGPMVRSVEVDFEMSAEDERKSILRLKLRIVFKTIVKRGIVEIYLDPRA